MLVKPALHPQASPREKRKRPERIPGQREMKKALFLFRTAR